MIMPAVTGSRLRRVALFLPTLSGGGAERVMAQLANGFAGRGYDVDLVLAKAEGPYLAEVAEHVRIIDLGKSRVMAAVPSLARYLRHSRPDALLSAMKHANVAALLARGLSCTRIPVVVSEHSQPSAYLSAEPRIKSRLLAGLMRLTYPHAERMITVSNGVAADLAGRLHLDPSRMRTIYNPVDIESILDAAEQPTGHLWYEDSGPPVILSAGRLAPPKDFETLLQAFALASRKTKARLVILGEGGDRSRIEARIRLLGLEDHVSLPGFMLNPYGFMKQSAVFVLSSRWEGLSNVLLEAMACGTPVVSTDCPSGPAEILEGGKWGRLVPVGDPEAMADAIVSTLRDPGPSPLARAIDFSLDRTVDAYLDALLPNR